MRRRVSSWLAALGLVFVYNRMIAPIVPYAIRGAIWYQGESKCGRAYQYRTLMPLLIQDWRAAWDEVKTLYHRGTKVNHYPCRLVRQVNESYERE